jgi:hypothetical protein
VSIGIGIGQHIGRAVKREPQWVDLGVVPTIAAETTANGRAIGGLVQWNNRIYMSYGDYNSGTANVQILSWNEQTEAFMPSLGTFNSDGIHIGRIIGNELWYPSIDPRTGTDGFIAKITAAHAYSQYTANGTVVWHVFDCAEFNGQPMLIGSAWVAGTPACDHGAAWRFNGTSWDKPLSVPPAQCGVAPSPGYRAYTGFKIGSRFYVKTHSTGGTYYTDDGTNWTLGPAIMTSVAASRALEVTGGVLCKTNEYPNGGGTLLKRFDGTTDVTVTSYSNDHVKGPDGLVYSLYNFNAANRKVQVSTNDAATAFSDKYTGIPALACSLCVTNQYIYLGTTDSHLWRRER